MDSIETLGLALGAGFLLVSIFTPPSLRLGCSSASSCLIRRLDCRFFLIPGSLEVPSPSICWNSWRTKSRTSTLSGTPSTLLSDPPLPPCSLSRPPGQLHRNGAGGRRCSPAESLSLRIAQKPARAPPSTPAPNRLAIGF